MRTKHTFDWGGAGGGAGPPRRGSLEIHAVHGLKVDGEVGGGAGHHLIVYIVLTILAKVLPSNERNHPDDDQCLRWWCTTSCAE